MSSKRPLLVRWKDFNRLMEIVWWAIDVVYNEFGKWDTYIEDKNFIETLAENYDIILDERFK